MTNKSIWTMGEMLCEIMRPEIDMPLDRDGTFLGPFPAGAPANFIDTAARLGHKAGIIGGVGKDDFGKCILRRMRQSGVDCSQVTQYTDGTTGVSFVTYFSDGSRKFLFHFPDTPATRPTAPDIELLGDVGYFHIMGCSLMAKREFGTEILKVMNGLAEKGTKISFDPNIRPELMKAQASEQMVAEVMKNCSVLLPGVKELLMVSGKETVASAVAACFKNPKIEVIALKDGEKGCTVYTRDRIISRAVYNVKVKDPTGAGDSFDAAFLCALLEGKTLDYAAKMASAAAALTIEAFGPMEGDISRANVEKMINEKTPGL